MGAQAGAHILNTLVLFLLLFGTYLFQVGLIGELAQRFRHALYIVPVYFVAVAAQAASKVVSASGAAGSPARRRVPTAHASPSRV